MSCRDRWPCRDSFDEDLSKAQNSKIQLTEARLGSELRSLCRCTGHRMGRTAPR